MRAAEAPSAPRRFGPWRREATAWLEFLALASLAVTQPTFDLLGKNARLFIAWQTTRWELVALALMVALLPAVAVWSVEVAVGLVAPRARSTAYLLLIAALAVVVVLEALKVHTKLDMALAVIVALGLGVGTALLVRRVDAARTWLHVLAIAAVAFPALFLFASPAHDAVLAAEPTASQVEIEDPKRVVMIVLDELPTESLLDGSGAIDRARFPNFAALADTGTWYRNATTVAPNTEAAVPAILTGRMPVAADAAPVAQVHPRNLFTMLAETYSLNVHESITRLCPLAICPDTRRSVEVHAGFSGMVRDVATIVEHILTPTPSRLRSGDWARRTTPPWTPGPRSSAPSARPRPATRLRPRAAPAFPLALPAERSGLLGVSSAPGRSGRRPLDQRRDGPHRPPAALAAGGSRGLLLGEVVARLQGIGAYDDSIVVVTADHGVAFEPSLPFRGVAERTHTSIMWTPLLVKAAGQQFGVVDDRPALSVDVLPTLVDQLGAHPPWTFDGQSLPAKPRPEGPRPLFTWASNAVSPPDGSDFSPRRRGGVSRGAPRRGIAPSDPPTLGAYRTGTYGALVGRSPYPMIVPGPAATVTIEDPIRYQYVDHTQSTAPWSTMQGTEPGGTPSPSTIAAAGEAPASSISHRFPRMQPA